MRLDQNFPANIESAPQGTPESVWQLVSENSAKNWFSKLRVWPQLGNKAVDPKRVIFRFKKDGSETKTIFTFQMGLKQENEASSFIFHTFNSSGKHFGKTVGG